MIQLKVTPVFPSNVTAENFITLTKEAGNWSISVDYSVLTPGPVADPSTAFIAVQDQTSGIYRTVSLTSLLTSSLDVDLQAIAALTGTGVLSRTADGAWALRTMQAPAAGLTITNPGGVAGNETFALANDLAAVEGLASTGIAVRSATDTWVQRSVVAGFGMTVTNGDGVAGNMSVAVTDPELVALAGLVSAADQLPYFTGSGTASLTTLTTFGRSLIDDADATTARATLGVVIGTNVQAFDSDLAALAANAGTGLWAVTGSGTGAVRTITAPAAGITVSNGGGVAGNPTLALADDLAAVEGLATTGIVRRTGTSTWTAGTLVTNAERATMPAYTLKGNATGSTASEADIDVTALTAKASPVAGDIVLIQDSAASNAFKRTTVGALSSAGSVSSIAGNTGAFTLANGLSNSTNAISQLSKGSNIAEANGGLEIWQIGTSVAVAASNTAYCGPDRFYMSTGATQAHVVSRQAGIVNGSRYAAKVLRNSGQTGTSTLKFAYPFITDEVVRCQSQLLALSFTAKAGANFSPTSGTLTYNVYFGTGAAAKRGAGFTSETNPITGTVNLTTTAAQVVSIASGAAGASVTQGEILFTWTPVGTAGADDSFTIDDVRLDIIPVGTTSFSPPIEHLDHGVYFAACRQIYRQSYPEGTAPGTIVAGGKIAYIAPAAGGEALPAYPYTPTLWATPIATLYSPDTGASGNNRNASAAADVAGIITNVTTDGHASFSVAHTAGSVYWYHYTSDARL